MASHPQRLPPPPPPPPYPPFRLLRYRDNRLWTFPCRPFIQLPFQHAPEDPSTLIRKLLFESGSLSSDEQSDYLLFSHYNQAVSITQEGPTCGPVALMMAVDSLGMAIPEINDILKKARESHYTLHGEMYSAINFSNFIEYIVPEVRGIHIKNLADKKQQMIEHLSSGWPILMPYDADRNHYPCEANGYHAHWAVILGYCMEMRRPKGKNIEKTLSLWQKDSSHGHLYHLNSPDDAHLLRDFLNSLSTNASRVFFYAKQGKSSKARLFDCDQLIRSNLNLNSIAPYSTRDLLIPEGGVRAGLSDQAILIKPKNIE